MALEACLGYKSCKKLHCRQRCKSWFGAQPDLERACDAACSGNYNLATKDEFLCTGNYVDRRVVMSAYGYDPCSGQDATIEEFYDPTGEKQQEAERTQMLWPIVIALLVLVGITGFFLMRRLSRKK